MGGEKKSRRSNGDARTGLDDLDGDEFGVLMIGYPGESWVFEALD